jgi:hypothetical protein
LIEAIAAKKITGIEDLITSKIAIEDLVEKGFLALLNGRGSEGIDRNFGDLLPVSAYLQL